jgi:hypothetical protein
MRRQADGRWQKRPDAQMKLPQYRRGRFHAIWMGYLKMNTKDAEMGSHSYLPPE